jgi:hypothetical protein
MKAPAAAAGAGSGTRPLRALQSNDKRLVSNGSTPAIGWIRADDAAEALAAPEVLRLRKRIEELEGRLEEARSSAPKGSDTLAQGDDLYQVNFTFDTTDTQGKDWSWSYCMDVSWNTLFYDVGPIMINEATDLQIRTSLSETMRGRSLQKRRKDEQLKEQKRARSFRITDHDFQTIKFSCVRSV